MEFLPHPSNWPHRPIFLATDVRVDYNGHDKCSLPLGKTIDFETDTFKGRFFLRLRHVKPHHDDDEKHVAYFDGAKRFYQCIVQGRFKEEDLTFYDIVQGDVYERRLKGVPHGTIGKVLRKMIESLSPGLMFDIFDDKQPKVLSPIGGCQTMSVDLPGDEPKDFDNIKENTTLIGVFGSKEERRKILSKPKYARKYKIDTDVVYTFETYDDIMDFGTFHQYFGRAKVDLIPSLDGQSLSFGMYTRSLRRIYSFSLWHERALAKQNGEAR